MLPNLGTTDKLYCADFHAWPSPFPQPSASTARLKGVYGDDHGWRGGCAPPLVVSSTTAAMPSTMSA
jgi:hypothetical protein